MADKLTWLNQHFILLRHRTLREAIEQENYKLRPDLASFSHENISSEDFLQALIHAEKYKEACDFLAYAMHRRAAIWWGYRCLLSLIDELAEKPATERDIADIGAPKPMPIPDWAKGPSPEAEAQAEAEENAQTEAELEAFTEKLNATIADAKKLIPPEVQKKWDAIYAAINQAFVKEHGLTMEELVKKAAEKSAEPLFIIDPNSPIFQAEKALREKIESVRKNTVDLIKTVIPPTLPDHQKKQRDDAMQAIYRWVIAPDEINSQAALDIGNACPDQPAGLMAMAAFWSFGNLTPTAKQVVATPPGLAANGICSALLQAALHKGGTRDYKARCEHYFTLGLKVVWGKDTWGEMPEKPVPPHREPQSTPVPPSESPSSGYTKWTVTPPHA